MVNNVKEIDQFNAKIVKTGSSSSIIIPHDQMQFSGLEIGDVLKVWYKRIKKNKPR